MRLQLASVLAVQLLAVVTATAGPRGGNGSDDRGRLGRVTDGIDSTTGSGGGRGGGSSQGSDHSHEGDLYRRRHDGQQEVLVDHDGTVVRRFAPPSRITAGPASVDLFVGVGTVVESERSYSLALAVEDRWFRLAGAVSEYREHTMDGGTIAMTVPTLLLGARITPPGPTRAFFEVGAAFVRTKEDGVVGSNIAGPIAGVHLEHRLGGPSLVGDAHVMMFEDQIMAYRGRVGVRVGILELGLRILDFNVGPALFGPEVGLSF